MKVREIIKLVEQDGVEQYSSFQGKKAIASTTTDMISFVR
jgi:hypothetical protein